MKASNYSTETAFGGESGWLGSAPALIAGGITLLLAAYGTWILPGRLPAFYERSLSQAESEYEQYQERNLIANANNLARTAGELAVIHKRLITLNRGDPASYWGLAEFQRQHAGFLQEELNDASASFLESDRETLMQQADTFRRQSQEWYRLLAAERSEFQLKALYQLTSDATRQGLQRFGVAGAAEKADALASLLLDPEHAAELQPGVLNDARLLLVRLQIEAAWQSQATNSLARDSAALEQAAIWMEQFAESSVGEQKFATDLKDLRWLATQRLLEAYREENAPIPSGAIKEDVALASAVNSESVDDGDWQVRLAELELLAIQGKWQEVGFTAASQENAQDWLVRSSLARTICRLACSPRAYRDPEFAGTFDAALALAYSSAPHVPELADLVWESAQRHCDKKVNEREDAADVGTQSPKISSMDQNAKQGVASTVVESLLAGKDPVLKHSVLAISMALQERFDVARNHLQLILRSGGELSLIARAVLRSFQPGMVPKSQVVEAQRGLLQMMVMLEPKAGLNWFALANTQLASSDLHNAKASLEQALELLGEVPAIREMLAGVDKRLVE